MQAAGDKNEAIATSIPQIIPEINASSEFLYSSTRSSVIFPEIPIKAKITDSVISMNFLGYWIYPKTVKRNKFVAIRKPKAIVLKHMINPKIGKACESLIF